MDNFNGRVAVITGSGSGIGRALALELALRGARLAVSDVNRASADAVATACEQRGGEARAYALDVADREAVFAHAEAVRADFGQVNLVVNNAGVAMHKDVVDTAVEDYEWIFSINFWGVLYGSKAFVPHLIASGEGHLVNISSLFGMIAVPSQSGYNATKFAVRGFTEALRQEMLLAGHPVGVSCVHPGGIRTNIARSARIGAAEDAEEMANAFEQVARTSPQAAARIILRGVERRRARILVGPDARALDLLQRVAGSAYQGLVYRTVRRLDRVGDA